ALRSGIRWREEGKLSPGYLKSSVAVRASKKLIPPMINPTTDNVCTTKDEMLEAAAVFYKNLYSLDEVSLEAIDDLLCHLSSTLKLPIVNPLQSFHPLIMKRSSNLIPALPNVHLSIWMVCHMKLLS
ncbi:hypothetical protein BDB01DRAFT_729784, partial [Pilobolus umbonatus]